MSDEAVAAPDSAAGVTPGAPWRIRALTVLPAHRLAVTFNDGRKGVIDLSGAKTAVDSGIYAALADPGFFEKASLELGAVTWPNGADLDPAWMYEMLAGQETWTVPL